MYIKVHPRIEVKRPEISPEDIRTTVDNTLRSRARDTDPVQWVGVGMDGHGRLLEYVAVEVENSMWLVFHGAPVTKSVLREVGLGRDAR
jgi:hypothetical protein